MKKLYLVETNAYKMLVTVDECNVIRFFNEEHWENCMFDNVQNVCNNDNDEATKEAFAKAVLDVVEDDSSWEIFENEFGDVELSNEEVEEFFEGFIILAEKDFE